MLKGAPVGRPIPAPRNTGSHKSGTWSGSPTMGCSKHQCSPEKLDLLSASAPCIICPPPATGHSPRPLLSVICMQISKTLTAWYQGPCPHIVTEQIIFQLLQAAPIRAT
eukprot:1034976-Ditylum_brightwellii.AAC.1